MLVKVVVFVVAVLRLALVADAEKRAYVSVVLTDDFVQPCVVMGLSLRAATKTTSRSSKEEDDDTITTDYVCLYLPRDDDDDEDAGVSPDGVRRLERSGWSTRRIDARVRNPNYDRDEDEESYAARRHVWNYNKLYVWTLTEYDKVVYLDSDLLVLKDPCALFDRDVWSDDGDDDDVSRRRPRLAAAPDNFPADQFNSGVLVLRPDYDVFRDMTRRVRETPSLDKGDQGFLNQYFSEWYAAPAPHRLPSAYNLAFNTRNFPGFWEAARKDAIVVHFTGHDKPWLLIQKMNEGGGNAGTPSSVYLLYLWLLLDHLSTHPPATVELMDAQARYVLTKIDLMAVPPTELSKYTEHVMMGRERKTLKVKKAMN